MPFTQINSELGITNTNQDCIAVSLLSEAGQRQVTRLLSQIVERLGDSVWPMPAEALHITLCEIIQPKTYEEDKDQLFLNVPQYESVLEQVLEIPSIEVKFDAIEVSPQAIIIKGTDDGTFNRVREKLVELLPLPRETKAPPDIIHSSIARFRKEVDLDEVRAAVADLNVNFKELVGEIQLLKGSAPHLVNYILARRYTLH